MQPQSPIDKPPRVTAGPNISIEYGAVNGLSGPKSLFLTHEWFENFVETVAKPAGIAPLFTTADTPGAPLLALGLQGGSVGSLTNYYSCGYGVATIGAAPNFAAVQALVNHMIALPRRSAEIRLSPIHEDDPSLPLLIASLNSAGWVIEKYLCHVNWSLPVDGRSFDSYVSTLSSRMRNTIRRKHKAFVRAGGRLVVLRTQQALDVGLPAFNQVYAKSWKRPESFPDFIPGLVHRLAPLDIVRIGVAWMSDQPVAVQLWFHYRDEALVYKLAYDERYESLSAGTLLTAEMLRYAMDDDRVSLIDHLTGDDAYKRDWMSRRRVYYGISACDPRSVTSLVARARNLYKRIVRN